MNEAELKGLVHNNRNLVRLANNLVRLTNKQRKIISAAMEAITAVVESAVLIAGANEKNPTEYVASRESLDLLVNVHQHYLPDQPPVSPGWWPDNPSPSTLHLQQTCGCCGADYAPEELEEHIGMVMYCRHCLDNDLVAGADALAKVCADVGGRDCDLMTGRHDCYVCNGIAGRCPECADK